MNRKGASEAEKVPPEAKKAPPGTKEAHRWIEEMAIDKT